MEEEEIEPMVENPEVIEKEMEALYGTDKATEILGCKIVNLDLMIKFCSRGVVILLISGGPKLPKSF